MDLVEDSAKKMPPVRGVIHGVMVLKVDSAAIVQS